MKVKDADNIRDTVEAEGFDYAFRCYSGFSEVTDRRFHELRIAYVKAAEELSNYCGLEDL